MKTNVYDAPLYSLIVLFAILVVGGGLAFYPPHFDHVRNEATPIGLTEEKTGGNSNVVNDNNYENNLPTDNIEVSGTTSEDVHTGKIEFY